MSTIRIWKRSGSERFADSQAGLILLVISNRRPGQRVPEQSQYKTSIGAEFSQVSGYLYIVSAIKGSPAETAGLKSGDVIEYIDGKATRDISLYDAEGWYLASREAR